MRENIDYYDRKSELISKDELKTLQLRKLKHAIDYVYQNSPYYRRSFKEKGLGPDDIQSLDDIKKFPFTTKDV
ncbi:MAG TPA: phenylacetate--CoA ligase, partial [Nitrososphaerales archaeon]|nr:phenylacetate--CoA ligase [Nitrososphaerales archaeon]